MVIYANGTITGPAFHNICDREFGDEEAAVVCRQMGCNPVGARRTPAGRYNELPLIKGRGHATPIVTVQTSKLFSITKNSNIAPVRTRACLLPREGVIKIVTLKNFYGCTSCMPSCKPLDCSNPGPAYKILQDSFSGVA